MKFDNDLFKKVLGVASIVMTGVVAVTGALSDQKKENEFNNMKKDLEDLKNQNK